MTTSSSPGRPGLTVQHPVAGDDPAVVALRGELDMATAGLVEKALDAIETNTPAVLILDLTWLTFVDSSGIRLVLLAQDRAHARGARLALRLGDGAAHRVFRTLGLLDRLDVVDHPTT